jgi:hypothetical protein
MFKMLVILPVHRKQIFSGMKTFKLTRTDTHQTLALRGDKPLGFTNRCSGLYLRPMCWDLQVTGKR